MIVKLNELRKKDMGAARMLIMLVYDNITLQSGMQVSDTKGYLSKVNELILDYLKIKI